ncbi:hypothetical protein B0H13DRAFT_2318209 [Mycena leptocephala]|nr:hypothetical protein B0H13DRAFT_2318209 [Mycena leptocephala]
MARPGIRVCHLHAHARAARCDITILLNCVIVGGRWSGVEANKGPGLGAPESEDTAPRPDDATSRRDEPGPAHGCGTWTCAWRNFQAPLPALPAPRRDDADMYARPEMRMVCSAPHSVLILITSLHLCLSHPPSLLPPHPRSLTTLTTSQSTPLPALRHRQRPHLGRGWRCLFALVSSFLSSLPRGFPLSPPASPLAESRGVTAGTGTDALRGVGHFGISQPRPLRLLRGGCFWYPPALSGTDANALPDPSCEQIPAAFHVELVLLGIFVFCPSAACGSADGDVVGMSPRAPAVSALLVFMAIPREQPRQRW